VLSEPMKGIGRFVWVIPYAIGASGLLLVGIAAIRWTRRAREGSEFQLDGQAPLARGLQSGRSLTDDSLNAKLDDELRDLD
jgi:hypothetical protein